MGVSKNASLYIEYVLFFVMVRVPHLLVQHDCYMPATKLLNTKAQENVDVHVENPPLLVS